MDDQIIYFGKKFLKSKENQQIHTFHTRNIIRIRKMKLDNHFCSWSQVCLDHSAALNQYINCILYLQHCYCCIGIRIDNLFPAVTPTSNQIASRRHWWCHSQKDTYARYIETISHAMRYFLAESFFVTGGYGLKGHWGLKRHLYKN